MRAICFLPLLPVLLLAGCAPPPDKPRGLFDLSSRPEPGGPSAPATLGAAPQTGNGRLGGLGGPPGGY